MAFYFTRCKHTPPPPFLSVPLGWKCVFPTYHMAPPLPAARCASFFFAPHPHPHPSLRTRGSELRFSFFFLSLFLRFVLRSLSLSLSPWIPLHAHMDFSFVPTPLRTHTTRNTHTPAHTHVSTPPAS
eukprot:TRINITY_DN6891_c5_g1_i1.p2 TRINITY_DN6891_c5_g1~~TRINITY_DN6891_c5_g1_i1.p2  ORF type:complete len:127 (+),score=0.65 TRINITY_DN6891_c5_g1_i1:80-460(+)